MKKNYNNTVCNIISHRVSYRDTMRYYIIIVKYRAAVSVFSIFESALLQFVARRINIIAIYFRYNKMQYRAVITNTNNKILYFDKYTTTYCYNYFQFSHRVRHCCCCCCCSGSGGSAFANRDSHKKL